MIYLIRKVTTKTNLGVVMWKNIRSFVNKLGKSSSFSLDDIIGERCKVVETVDNYIGCGLVKVKGQVWSARGVNDDDIFGIGERLTVVAIEGVKLICRKN